MSKSLLKKVNKLKDIFTELDNVMNEVPFGMSKYQIEQMVSNKQSDSRSYRQTVMEMHNRRNALKECMYRRENILIDIEELKDKIKSEENDFSKRRFELNLNQKEEQLKDEIKFINDAIIDFTYFYNVFKKLPKYTRKDFESEEPYYWRKKLENDAKRELLERNAITKGTQEALSRIGLEVSKNVDNKFVLLEKEDKTIKSIEMKLNKLKSYVAVLIPKRNTEEMEMTQWDKINYPYGKEIKFARAYGDRVEENRNRLLEKAIDDGAKYAFFVDCDNRLNKNTLIRFLEYMEANEDVSLLSGYSYMKDCKTAVAHNIKDNRTYLIKEGQGVIACNWVTGLACVMIRISDILDLRPLFNTRRENNKIIVGEDTYMCHKLIDNNKKVMINTDEVIEHININKVGVIKK